MRFGVRGCRGISFIGKNHVRRSNAKASVASGVQCCGITGNSIGVIGCFEIYRNVCY